MSSSPIFATLIVFVFCGLAYLIYYDVTTTAAAKGACRDRGGVWFKPYKSNGICLKPGMVLQ